MRCRKNLIYLFFIFSAFFVSFAEASPEDQPNKDRKAIVKYFEDLFSDVKFADFKDGVYAINEEARKQAEEINVFPPYEFELDKGKELFSTPLADGKTYEDCMKSGLLRERVDYPYFDTNKKMVKTLELEINECRKAHKSKEFKYKKGNMAALSAHIATRSAGKTIKVTIPNKDALKAYTAGKKFYYGKRGYLNNSCANCHVNYAGSKARGETLHPLLGEATGWPTYRLAWQNLGTLHRRIRACHRDQGAKSLKAQSETYRNAEYFMSYMSNGLKIDGPSVRK